MNQKASEEQQKALFCPVGRHCLVSAGPGSGKTFFLVCRVWQILAHDVNAKVCCISFTNEASKEIKRRLAGQRVNSSRTRCSTIHGYCLAGLNWLISSSQDFTKMQVVKSERQLVTILCSIISNTEKNLLLRAVDNLTCCDFQNCDESSEYVCDFVGEDDVTDYLGSEVALTDKEVAGLTRMLEEFCRMKQGSSMSMDQREAWGSVQAIGVRYFEKLAELKVVDLRLIVTEFIARIDELDIYIESTCKYLLVDELQDLDSEQLRLIHLLAEKHAVILTVVGDMNQSIYGWRRDMNSDPKRQRTMDNFDVLEASLGAHLSKFRFKLNFRCCQSIVGVSNAMIGDMTASKPVDSATPGVACALCCRHAMDELWRSIDILKHLQRKGSLRSTAVLFRYNMDKLKLLKIMKQQEIPYIVKNSVQGTVNRTKSLQAIAGILQLLSGEGSDSALTALTLCCQGKPQTHLVSSAFRSFCKDNENLPPKCEGLLKAFAANLPPKDFQIRAVVQTLLTRLQKIQKQCTVPDKIQSIVSLFKLRKSKDVEEFISLGCSADSEASALKLLSEHEMKSRKTVTDVVYVGTIHSAKGQEWPTVILPLLNEGTVPRENTDHREERRVLYVGVTRAVSALILTCSSGPNSIPSPFLLDASVSTTKQVSEILSLI